MKYGMRERLSGAVILIALAVIFVPMLFDEPSPRSERPQPVLTIDQPIDVERRDVPEPQPPSGLGEMGAPVPREEATPTAEVVDDEVAQELAEAADPPADPPDDPIAELARAADQRLAEGASREPDSPSPAPAPAPAGEWAVQVGSFGEPANAERLEGELREQGFNAYRRARDNDLTTVYVGPYDSSEAGERAMGELKSRANLQGLLVRVRE